MRSRMIDLPRMARALFRRGGRRSAHGHVASTARQADDHELLDERGNHVGTLRTTMAAPKFGLGAPTYLLTRLLRRVDSLGMCLPSHAKPEPENLGPEDLEP